MSLYNVVRPGKLSEVKGQENLIRILKENLSGGHLPNAMLFVGTRGTGKTTVAKIVAKQLNCESPLADGSCCDQCSVCRAIKAGNSLDVLELDAASNNGVDNIRSVIEQIQFKPVGNKKVVILDEVHMLSNGAFNALLKVMEEPPANVLFILCTTELHKIPATILSRCRKFQFDTISDELIMEKLTEINQMYGLSAEEGALRLVARAAKGSMRDAESIYENFLDVEGGVVSKELVMDTLGYSDEDLVFALLEGIIKGDPTISFGAIQQTTKKGGSLPYLLEESFHVLMDIITIHMGSDISQFAENEEYLTKVADMAHAVSTDRLFEITDAFKCAYEKKSGNLELVFQSMIIGIICRQGVLSQLQQKVARLEEEVAVLKEGAVSKISYAAAPIMEDSSNVEYDAITEENLPSNSVAEEDVTDEELSNVLASSGFTYIGSSPFDEDEADTTAADTTASSDSNFSAHNKSAEKQAEETYFGDFASMFGF